MLTIVSPFPNIGYNIVGISFTHKTNPLIMGPHYWEAFKLDVPKPTFICNEWVFAKINT
jgi:hypothetical protein